MNEIINQLELEIAQMRNFIQYYENRILQKQIAIEEIVQSKMSNLSLMQSELITVVEEKVFGVYALVKEILSKETEEIEYRILKAKCLNAHPEMRDRILHQFSACCIKAVKNGFKIKMPERKKKEINRVFNEKAIANGHTTEHVVVS